MMLMIMIVMIVSMKKKMIHCLMLECSTNVTPWMWRRDGGEERDEGMTQGGGGGGRGGGGEAEKPLSDENLGKTQVFF